MGVAIMLVHTYYGYTATGGPAGVGAAVGHSVRTSLIVLVLLLLAFAVGGIKPAALQMGAGLLLAEMLLFFIPALMSLLDYGGLLRDEGWRILLVIGVSTLVVMLVTAFTVELVCRWSLRHEA